MIPQEIYKLKNILDSFLGESKRGLDESLQLEYPCPLCVEEHGDKEINKYNLSISLSKQLFNCWKCSSVHDEMHGSIIKLIKLYGNDSLLKDYKETIISLKESKLYKINYSDSDFNIDYNTANKKEVELPKNFHLLKNANPNNKGALKYLFDRGLDWDIINDFKIGYTDYDKTNLQASSRIIIPSYNEFGELNYWTGRDFTNLSYRQKYYNPVVERKDIIFNEEKVQWDADITLVEGPFDHIVVPNSIPLLGKSLKKNYLLYDKLTQKANGKILIFLDQDAVNDSVEIYKLLNHGRLYNQIRIIQSTENKDPSEIFNLNGRDGIINALRSVKKLDEVFLF